MSANTLVQHLSTIFKEKYLLDVSPFQEEFLERIVKLRMTRLGYHSFEEYWLELKYNADEVHQLWNDFHIPYSSFFREKVSCALMEERLLPKILSELEDNGPEIRIWIAGCARGEEAYSLAIMLDRAIQRSRKKNHVRLFATDVSQESIDFAIKGLYPKSSLAHVPISILEEYFIPQGGLYLIKPMIREHLIFSRFDLLDPSIKNPRESIYGGFDLVTCCNVLYYYKHEAQMVMMDKFYYSLKENGYLVTGETERMTLSAHPDFQELFPGFPIFQKKRRPVVRGE
ncbi:MAG: protein-glutamate O-methyltransferase CheR [Candidatus Izemoplasmatales bacterium]